MVHAGGRPREYDRDYIKKRLAAWAQEPSSLNINAFCCLPDIKISFDKLYIFCKDDEEFHEVYKEAKAYISSNREEANACKELSDAAYNKHLHVYDLAYKHATRDDKKFDVELQKDLKKFEKNLDKEVQDADSFGIKQKMDDVITQLKSLSDRKIEDSNISNETKS